MPDTQEQYEQFRTAIFPHGKSVYDKECFGAESQDLFYTHIVGKTLQGEYDYIFVPDYVFYVGKYPSAYIKKVESFSEPDVRKWQQFLWNQAVVPFLIVKTRTQLRVYSATTKPQENDSGETIEQLLETTVDALDSLKARLETGDFYAENLDKLGRENRVDQYLLDNLKAVANEMAKTQGELNKDNLQFAHRFLTRILFVCYLIERGMIKGKHFPEQSVLRQLRSRKESKPFLLKDLLKSLSTFTDRKDAIVSIFKYVKDRFNGSLFEESISSESKKYGKEFLDLLQKFLEGHEIASGQLTLGFWAYDFSVIPIEMISSVYDGFLKSEGEIDLNAGEGNSQSEAGAYYTPPHLAELAVDMALEGNKMPIHELTVVDPACGSGVFLVAMFGRMAQSLRQKMGYKGKRISINWGKAVLRLLPRIYGIDINPTACHITCFSLYLAALEQMSPMDVEDLWAEGEKFPSLLLDKLNRIEAGKNIIRGNFFDKNIPLTKSDFDLVVGNPPWVSRRKQNDGFFEEWVSLNKEKRKNVLAPDKQIAHGFMWRVIDFLSEKGEACLLLPANVFLNSHTNLFQEYWLKSVTLERVINFSDLRFVLFNGAIHPCVAVLFSKKPCDDFEKKVRYESPKVDVRSQQGGPVYIREEDTSFLAMKDLLKAAQKRKASEIWKGRYWGTWYDSRLLSRLANMPKISDLSDRATKTQSNKRWIHGQGIQIAGSDKNKAWWNSEIPFLDSSKPYEISIPEKLPTAKEAGIPTLVHRPRTPKLFYGPKVLMTKGSQRVIYTSEDLIFKDTFTSFTALKKEDADNIRFLAAVFSSDVTQYYLFHSSSNLGIYRPQIFPEDMLAIPFFLPSDAPDPAKAKGIIKEVSQKMELFEKESILNNGFGQEEKAVSLRRELEPLIREYYDINVFESMLIEDTVKTLIPSATPSRTKTDIPTLRPIQQESIFVYSEVLCDVLAGYFGKKTIGENCKAPFSASIFHGYPYTIVQLEKVPRARKIRAGVNSEKMKEILHCLESILEEQVGSFTFCKNIKVFYDEALYIIKPSQYRFWLKTAALNDADEIMSAIVVAKEGEKI